MIILEIIVRFVSGLELRLDLNVTADTFCVATLANL
jgi:hypothetical protein